MRLYGLTGGIGSGKSTVSKMLEEAGISVISADYLNLISAREPHIQQKILDRFGTLDRMQLRKIIFADMKAKKDIEAIMHPEVQDKYNKRLKELADKEVVVYDSALIFEMNQDSMFRGVIVVQCPEHVRRQRVLIRDNMDEEITDNIMGCQVSDDERWERADYLINNDGPMSALEKQTRELILQIVRTDFLLLPSSSG